MIKNSDKINWEQCNSRRLAVQGALAWNGGIGKHFQNRYNCSIQNTLTYFDGKKTDYFFDKQHHEEFNKILDTSFDNPEFVTSMIPESIFTLEEIYQEIVDFLSNKDNDLAKFYKKVAEYHAYFYPRKWMAFRISKRIDLQVAKELRKIGKNQQEIEEILQILALPLKPNYVILEKMDLCRLAIKGYTEEDLRNHTKKYRHIPLFDFDHDPYTIEYFNAEINLLQNPKEELDKLEQEFNHRKEEYKKIIKELNPSLKLKNLITMMKHSAFFRDYADTIRQKLNYHLRGVYILLGEKVGLTLEEIALLTNDEIEHHLHENKAFDKEEIERRKQAFLLVQLKDEVSIISGEEAMKEAQRLQLYETVEPTTTIKGLTASNGKKVGFAKVVYTNKDLKNIKEGDIMVTTMTRQDFVPAMRKIQALVTDEGGIVSHAAIMARELELPCIVGTKHGTKQISDGDIILFEGSTGTVEILRKAENTLTPVAKSL